MTKGIESIPKPKRISKRALIRRADKLFSEVVRRGRATNSGYCCCVTCGAMLHWKELDAGHFVARNYEQVRYDKRNVHPQCRACNRFRSGMGAQYAKYILSSYGREVFDELTSARRDGKLTIGEIMEVIDECKKELKNQQGTV